MKKILTSDVKKKVKEIKKMFPKLEVTVNGRSKIVYINNVAFYYEEIMELNLNKFKDPSTWGL